MKENINQPKVSIMIPTYNQEQYIAQAIESALMQDYKNLEVVVTDDCSTDKTADVIKKYQRDPRIKFIQNPVNKGRVKNYHDTFYYHTTGDWIINLDGDDYYTDKSFVSRAIANIKKTAANSQNVVAYIFKHENIAKIRKKYSYKQISEKSILISGREYFLNYAKIGRFGHMNTLYNRKIAIKIGDMYTRPYQASDFHSIIRIIILGDIILDSNRIGVWRIHGDNTTMLEVDKKQEQAMRTFDDIETFAKNYFSTTELDKWRRMMNKSSYQDYVSTYIHTKRNLYGILLLLKTFRLQYSYFRLLIYYILKR